MPLHPDDPRVRINKTSFVIYEHPDLSKAIKFLLDFGLSIAHRDGDNVFFKGYGSDPFVYLARQSKGSRAAFGGAAYLVESRSELEKAARISGATSIQPLEFPGGGEIVTVHDPAGFPVHLVHGQKQKSVESAGNLDKLIVNFEDEKPRKGNFHRLTPGPAPVSSSI